MPAGEPAPGPARFDSLAAPLAHRAAVFASGETPFAATLTAQVFGAHTYERVDKPRGEFFHTTWTRTGGRVASSTYTV